MSLKIIFKVDFFLDFYYPFLSLKISSPIPNLKSVFYLVICLLINLPKAFNLVFIKTSILFFHSECIIYLSNDVTWQKHRNRAFLWEPSWLGRRGPELALQCKVFSSKNQWVFYWGNGEISKVSFYCCTH